MLKTFRKWWWILKAIFSRHQRKFFLFLIVLGVGLLSYPIIKVFLRPLYNEFIAPVQRPILSEGLVGSVKTLNPILTNTEAERDINELVFRSLTKNNSQGDPIGDLALDFKIENNKDYTFRLRDDIFWHDGKKFTADDVVYTIRIAADPNYRSPYYETLKDVIVTKLSDYQVMISLKEEFAPFLSLTNFGIIPEHVPLSRYKPVGTGEFKVMEVKSNYVLLRGLNFDMIFKLFATRDLAVTALKLGEIQALGGLSTGEVVEFSNWSNFSVFHQNIARRYVGLFFNIKNEKLADKELRKALQMATPRKEIISITTNNKAKEAVSSLPLNSWVPPYENPRYQFNLEEAKKALDRVGWKDEDGRRVKDGQQLTLTITTLDNRNLLEAIDVLKPVWESLGIRVEKQTVSSNQLRDNILPNHNYEILLNVQEVPSDPDQYNLWHSTQVGGTNFVQLSAPKVDTVLEDARLSLDRDERMARYGDFQRFLSDEAPVIFLYYPEYNYVVSKKVQGINLQLLSTPKDRFRSIGSWQVLKPLY